MTFEQGGMSRGEVHLKQSDCEENRAVSHTVSGEVKKNNQLLIQVKEKKVVTKVLEARALTGNASDCSLQRMA